MSLWYDRAIDVVCIIGSLASITLEMGFGALTQSQGSR